MFTRMERVTPPSALTEDAGLVAALLRPDVAKALYRRNILVPDAPGEDSEVPCKIMILCETPDRTPPFIDGAAWISRAWIQRRGDPDDPEHLATIIDAAIALSRALGERDAAMT